MDVRLFSISKTRDEITEAYSPVNMALALIIERAETKRLGG